MVTAALLSLALVGQSAPPKTPVLVNRKFVKGEINTYKINALLTIEIKEKGLETFLPFESGYEYGFTTEVKSVDEDGNAMLRYERTPMYQIDTQDESLGTKRTKVDDATKLELTLTPINQFIEVKEIKPPKPAAKPGQKPQTLRVMSPQVSGTALTNILAGQYMFDLYRLAMFVGSLDSSFDFSPKLPEDAVKVGDTWLSTVSYQPQKMSGSNRTQVQRLDMRYKYEGPMMVNGKPIERISATLGLDTDMTSFVNEQYGMSASDSPIKSLKMKFDSKITFDLQPKTFKTIRGQALSTGGIILAMKGEEGNFAERRLTGDSRFTLLGTKMAATKPAPSGGTRPRHSR